MMVAIRIVGLLYGFILLWCAGLPSIESLKWVIAAAVAMWVYQALLVQGYHFGDLSFVYPLARGVAPVILTAFAFLLIGESISPSQLLGVVSISLGIVTLALLGRGSRVALIYASLIGASVAAYSLLSGAGVRLSGNLFGFSAALEIASGVGFLLYAAIARGRSFAPSLVAIGPTGIGAGLLSVVGYLTFLVAANYLPLGPVSAIRECSALFGVLIGIFVMREPFGVIRALGALLMILGILVLSVH
ncbi:MAG TPA: DMT family transporter [Stellaceae bacterium]|nr:DMT family transporter [Stellaceae bacterium]